MPKGELEVIEYVPGQAVLDAVSADRTHEFERNWGRVRVETRAAMSCAAGFAAVALHVLLLAPVLWTGAYSQHRQKHTYQGNVADLQWVALADSLSRSATIAPPSPASPSLMPVALTALLAALPASALPAKVSESTSVQPDARSSLGAVYGRYLGQIQARIDRAWQRPRTAIGAPLFQCQVQVDQDGAGRVQEVTLLECNGGAPWRLSLVHAIEAASPLPTPSNPVVFVHHVLLAFRAMAYAPGASAQLYEPPPSAAQSGDDPKEREVASLNAFQALREAVQARQPKVVKLQIEGSKVEVLPDRR